MFILRETQACINICRGSNALHQDLDNHNISQPGITVESKIPNTKKGQKYKEHLGGTSWFLGIDIYVY